jgi:hypothetical protein
MPVGTPIPSALDSLPKGSTDIHHGLPVPEARGYFGQSCAFAAWLCAGIYVHSPSGRALP